MRRHEKAAAIVIQSVARLFIRQRRPLVVQEFARQAEQLKRAHAAVAIQSVACSFACRAEISQRREQKNLVMEHQMINAVVRIQSAARSWECQRQLHSRREQLELAHELTRYLAATSIQACVRSWHCQNVLPIRRDEILRDKVNVVLSAASAVRIQAQVRSWQCKKEAAERRVPSLRIEFPDACLTASCIENEPFAETQIETCHVDQDGISSIFMHGELPPVDTEVMVVETEVVLPSRNTELASAVLMQLTVRGFILRRKLQVANNAAKIIQGAWRRCVLSLRMKLLQVFELVSNANPTQGISKIPTPMKKARTLIPRNSQSFNRIKGITPQLPRHHECGVFVEEILNSVTVVIQSTARRYIVRQEMLKIDNAARRIQKSWRSAAHQRLSRDTAQPSAAILGFSPIKEKKQEELNAKEQKTNTMRFSTDDENEMLILAQIYQQAEATADDTYARLYGGDSSACVSQYGRTQVYPCHRAGYFIIKKIATTSCTRSESFTLNV